MAGKDYKSQIKAKVCSLIDLSNSYLQTTPDSDHKRILDLKKLGEDIIYSCDSPNIGYNPYRDYPVLRAKQILEIHTIDYDSRFSFFSSEVKNLVGEVRSIALDWYKSLISEEKFKRFCLLLKVRDQMKQLSDKELFPPEDLRFLEPLNEILSRKWSNFQNITDGVHRISFEGYHWYFNEVIVILDLIRDDTWTHLKVNRKVVEIIQGIKGELAKVYQMDNPDLPKTRPYIHVEDLPAHLLPNIILAFRHDSNSLIFETVKGEQQVDGKELDTIIAKLQSLRHLFLE